MPYLIAFLKGLGFGVIAVVMLPILSTRSFVENMKVQDSDRIRKEKSSEV